MSDRRQRAWQFLAGLSVGVSIWYLWWRWTVSLNPDAMVFSVVVALAETLFFVGTLIFYHDIWQEGDTPRAPPPQNRSDVANFKDGDARDIVSVDVFITTYDEEPAIVRPTIDAAQNIRVPPNVSMAIWVLDDGDRPALADLARSSGVGYITRESNLGFKAGNLKNALLQTDGDFVMICDADTRVFPSFLTNTLGYFRDPNVAWVQTPHWFYDIPEGRCWQDWVDATLPAFLGQTLRCGIAKVLRAVSGQRHVGSDPMLSEPAIFFDVIQRRRNRNGASFCCGAGSIHRREALFQSALHVLGREVNAARFSGLCEFEPFKFHVSEDIYTSIQLQSDAEFGWRSVYHPDVECRMLSPWTVDAWATQKLKYAGGTFDIMLRDNPLFRIGMPWRMKLHYLATFWSYGTAIWMPIMMVAPIFSLLTGWAPVEAYSFAFFMHILPVLVLSELAIVVGCKGHNVNLGRVLAVGGLPITLRALWLVVRGQRPRFPTTPKTPVFTEDHFRRVMPNILFLALALAAIGYGVWCNLDGVTGYSASFLIVNVFWIVWNAIGHLRVIGIAMWRPDMTQMPRPEPQTHATEKGHLSNASI